MTARRPSLFSRIPLASAYSGELYSTVNSRRAWCACAAARVVLKGCHTVIREHFTLKPVRSEPEGARVTLEQVSTPPPCGLPETWSAIHLSRAP